MRIHDFNKTRLLIEKTKIELGNNQILIKEFHYELFNPERVVVAVRKFITAIEKAKSPLHISDAETAMGYTRPEFINHIQRQFTKDMSWQNRSCWHIDHIIPVSRFIKENQLDIKKINCLSNLRPIMARENIIKGDRVTTLF